MGIERARKTQKEKTPETPVDPSVKRPPRPCAALLVYMYILSLCFSPGSEPCGTMSHDQSRSDSGESYKSRYANKLLLLFRSKGHSSSSIFFTRLRIGSGQIDVWSVLVQRYFERQQGIGEPLACWENNTIYSISRKVLDCPVTASYFLYMHVGAAHCRAIVTTPGKMTYLRRETLPIEWKM